MSELPVHDVPVTLVAGALGVGKTTAVLDLLAHAPSGARWAVLVNDVGRVGIDGATLAGRGVVVKEVPGGCICCTAGLSLRVGLVQLLREVRPHRLVIEPSGIAHPGGILDQLHSPGLRGAVASMATVVLVDPRRFADPVTRGREVYHAQLEAADVLVANRADLASPEELRIFREVAAGWYPPKLEVAVTEQGRLDPRWLDLRPSPGTIVREVHDHGAPAPADPATEPGRYPLLGPELASCGWIFPRDAVFDRDALEVALHELVRPCSALPAGVLRLKGVLRVRQGWRRVDATPDAVTWRPVGYRRDSRIELLVPSSPAPSWELVEARLRSALMAPGAPGRRS